ncbi:hypothetical protein ACTWQL_17800 [Pseudalkalibacillus sp. R45]|uniref:hypothetical protein n=1 Tax=Pseudalkalibacillus sp. R45 TaxID=3457433 RepID=UPI003FCEC838
MISEVYIDLCFIRKPQTDFKGFIEQEFRQLFPSTIHWYLDVKVGEDFEMIIAELRGMGRWQSEEEVMAHLDKHGSERFWDYLQGVQMNIYPVMKGCARNG